MQLDLLIQVKAFVENRDSDYDELLTRFGAIQADYENIRDCFELLCTSVSETQAETALLSIVQHMMCIRDDLIFKFVDLLLLILLL